MPRFALFLSFFLVLQQQVSAQNSVSPTSRNLSEINDLLSLEIKQAIIDVDIDGTKSPGEWDDAVELSLDYEIDPGNNTPAESRTIFYLKYDSDNIYFAFEAFDDNPEEIRSFISDRDNVFNSDRVGVYIDPFNTNASAYDFTVSASGIQMDGIVFGGGGGYDSSWDAIWSSDGHINENGYFVEVRIPLKSIRYPSTKETQTWSISAWRKIPRSEVVETRSHPMYQDINCQLCQFNRVEGFENLSTNRNIEILPTYVGNKTDVRENITDDDMNGGRINTSFGVDAKVGITNNIILNSTINPDFSQVEADAAQFNINNRFALRFEEQRPFFQEGSEIFNTLEEVVFTRTIADPVFGNKLTGKFGRSEAALLVAQDEINNLIFPANDGSSNTTLTDKTTSVFGRYKFTVNPALSGGLTSTSRFGSDYSNLVNSADVYFRPINPLTVELQYIHSETEYPDQVATDFNQPNVRFGGNAFFITSEYDTRQWQSRVSYLYRDPDFRADAGFIPQVDVKGFNYYLRKKLWSDGQDWFTRFFFTVGGARYENFNEQKTSSYVYGAVNYTGPSQSSASVQFYPFRTTRHLGDLYELGPRFNASLRMRPVAKFQYNLSYDIRDEVDFSNLDTGTQSRYGAGIDLRIGQHLETGFNYSLTTFNRDGDYLFRANILESNIRYNFTQRFFIRSILQYRFTRRNPDLYMFAVNPTQQTLFTQWLLSYKLNARSVFFLGYSDNYLGYEDILQNRVDLIQTDRTFFFKIGYLWRF
jgi:hypothetical protein